MPVGGTADLTTIGWLTRRFRRAVLPHELAAREAGPYLVGMNPSEELESSTPSPPPDLVLVGCVKTKRAATSAAKDLYKSPLWRCRRAYAESLGCPWYILSAKYGLLDPEKRIDTYDLALKDLRAKCRREWSSRVLDALKCRFPSLRNKVVEIHAGAAYVQYGLEEGLGAVGAVVHRPLARVPGVGRQQTWYQERLRGGCP